MIEANRIRERMEVVGSDGKHIGRVDKVRGAEIELAKLDLGAGLQHHLIPISWVEDVDEANEKLRLDRTRDDAKAQWRVKH
jgi:hypothetical protein